MGDVPAQVPGLGWESLALSFASLGVVCLLAWAALRLLAGRGVGRLSRSGAAVRVVARCPLEPRRSLYVVETAGRCLLVGVGEGPMTLLAELDPAKLPAEAPAPAGARSLHELLARLARRPPRAEGP
jgi:flagellar biosynthetic protein FliO